MHPKIVEVLAVFKVRAIDMALQGRMCYTQEAFKLAAVELEAAIIEANKDTPKPEEPPNLIAFIPPACVELVHEALHFNPHDEDAWEALGMAALACQNGPS